MPRKRTISAKDILKCKTFADVLSLGRGSDQDPVYVTKTDYGKVSVIEFLGFEFYLPKAFRVKEDNFEVEPLKILAVAESSADTDVEFRLKGKKAHGY